MLLPYFTPKRLRKTSIWLADQALEKLHHRFREGQFIGSLLYLLSVQFVLDHELSKITDDFGGRSNLNERDKEIMKP